MLGSDDVMIIRDGFVAGPACFKEGKSPRVRAMCARCIPPKPSSSPSCERLELGVDPALLKR